MSRWPLLPPSRPSLALKGRTGRLAGALALLLAALPGVAMGEGAHPNPDARAEAFGPIAGLLVLPDAGGTAPLPAVIILPDTAGRDPRADRYVEQLIGSGLAVLELFSDEIGGEALDSAARTLAADARIDGTRLGVLSFGGGVRVITASHWRFAAAALLYPGCASLPLGQGGPAPWVAGRVLLAHGTADPANPPARCAEAAAALSRLGARIRRLEYAHAGFAWDYPAYGLARRQLLPAPGGDGRIPAHSWPDLAALSATQVAGFFALALKAPQP